jgi:hypothetical protein
MTRLVAAGVNKVLPHSVQKHRGNYLSSALLCETDVLIATEVLCVSVRCGIRSKVTRLLLLMPQKSLRLLVKRKLLGASSDLREYAWKL